jgi:hypothetical protein
MNIPNKFYLYGFPVTVEIDNSLEAMGKCMSNEHKIKLSSKNCKTRALFEQTFCHELLHIILLNSKVINRYKLDNGKELWLDEDFIDNVSALLHQSFTSSEGNIKWKQ